MEDEEHAVRESEAVFLAEELQSFAHVSAAGDHLALKIEREARRSQRVATVLLLDASEKLELERVLGRVELTRRAGRGRRGSIGGSAGGAALRVARIADEAVALDRIHESPQSVKLCELGRRAA